MANNEEFGVLPPDKMLRVWKATLATERRTKQTRESESIQDWEPILFRNDSGEEIPAYGCMQITGTVDIGDRTFLTVDKPINWTGAVVGPFLFNNPWPVDIDAFGTAQNGPVYRAIGDGTSFSVGMRVGPVDASFEVGKGCLYSYLGADQILTDCIRLIDCTTSLMALTDGSGIASGGSGTVTARIPSSTNWSGGTVTYTAHNDALTGIGASKRVILFPLDAKWMAVEVC